MIIDNINNNRYPKFEIESELEKRNIVKSTFNFIIENMNSDKDVILAKETLKILTGTSFEDLMKKIYVLNNSDYYSDNKPLYKKLKKQKEDGEILILNNITREELIHLWHRELLSDNGLAKLFNTANYSVKKIRDAMNINKYNVRLEAKREEKKLLNIDLDFALDMIEIEN